MECKYKPNGSTNKPNNELIDTLWNVNLICTGVSIVHFRELIDTLWNVNATFARHEQ